MIHSFGGDPLTAWKLMSILREQFAKYLCLSRTWHLVRRHYLH